jgi:hypothetical protein
VPQKGACHGGRSDAPGPRHLLGSFFAPAGRQLGGGIVAGNSIHLLLAWRADSLTADLLVWSTRPLVSETDFTSAGPMGRRFGVTEDSLLSPAYSRRRDARLSELPLLTVTLTTRPSESRPNLMWPGSVFGMNSSPPTGK